MTNTYVLTGTLTDPQTVKLSEPLPVPPGDELRLTVEVLPTVTPTGAKPEILQVIAVVHEQQRQRGHVPPSAEEIQEYLRGEREGWRDL